MKKPVLMIHEFREEMLDLPLEEYTLTFDDGLYTQYMFLDDLRKVDTKKIFFITTGIIAPTDMEQSERVIMAAHAHNVLFEAGIPGLQHYMNWDQITEISQYDDCEIGGHSHLHDLPNTMIQRDTTRMMLEFTTRGFRPTAYAFPYNVETPVYKEVLKLAGFTDFYGSERTDIYELY